jgi:hypothetical protein
LDESQGSFDPLRDSLAEFAQDFDYLGKAAREFQLLKIPWGKLRAGSSPAVRTNRGRGELEPPPNDYFLRAVGLSKRLFGLDDQDQIGSDLETW